MSGVRAQTTNWSNEAIRVKSFNDWTIIIAKAQLIRPTIKVINKAQKRVQSEVQIQELTDKRKDKKDGKIFTKELSQQYHNRVLTLLGCKKLYLLNIFLTLF